MSAKERPKGKVIKDSVTLLPCFYFVELPILASSVVSLYFLELTDVFKPVHSGFSCYDRSLSMPYIEPTQEAIPFLMLLSLAFAGPAITIMVGEGILYCCLSKRRNGVGLEPNINAGGCNFNSFLRRAVRFVGVHVFGLCSTALITDIIQLSTGYQAPYFLTVCKPNYTSLNVSCKENSYIVEDICSGSDLTVINSGRKSFPSQHATLAAFAAVYISMYFNSTLTDSSKLLKPLLVFTFIICGIICGLTRITQYKNHPVDVYCGFLIGGGIALYLGLYAVGNFLPSEESLLQHREALRSLADLTADSGRVVLAKAGGGGGGSDGLAHPEGILSRNPRDCSSLSNLKRANADVQIITPRSPMGKENMVTFSNTLPRANTPSVEDPVRRNASIHASMDSARSKQLLTQWKSKNESRKMSLQVMDLEPGQSPPRSIEMRSSSEPSRVGVNGDHHGPGQNQYLKIQGGAVPPGCTNSLAGGGPRVSIQSRPGSSQLVHIPEETQENIHGASPKSSSARAKWLKAAEKTVACNRSNSQPRIMQVIAMSKQQGVLQGSPKSTEGSTVSCTGSIRYKTLTDHEPPGIVRVEAHPENNRPPIIQIPSTAAEGEGSGSWKWKAPEKGSLRQTYELNDLNRDSESCESLKDSFGSGDRKRSNIDANSEQHHHHHHQALTTIRVTPVEGSSELGSETLSISSSRDSTLRRKGNIILIPERSTSPENTRNIFYKGTSPTRAYKD
ncbi:2-lysophosphatidate phosphatase PLPPR4 isoform X2 [Dipodomys spectabilis]|uniref:2-lysophosphatidate phosphatase PLPPR4 isoform X2 n=1 Tax=Dipodomys spectabilis TaxID=105255 RepID=UPI001C53657F|nr:2-lysophosphatidate phosphatase PLPPR4 isoform X2 [Dipodomys spectabilis]